MGRASSKRRLWWIAVLQVVLLLASIASPAAAAVTPESMTGSQLVQLLQSYGLVKGDDTGNLNLNQPITRAEMITIMVRAMGAEEEASLYKGFRIFQDSPGHWAEGNLNYAGIKRLVKGDGNGYVRPQDQVSYGEALTMLVRLIGKEPTTGEWPLNVLFTAVDLKIVPDGITAGMLREKAVRGMVFQAFAKAITTVPMADGKTFLQTYVDKTPPTVTVNDVTNANQAQVQVTGTHRDAVSVTVNNKPATISGNTWSVELNLEYGENNLNVVAVDAAGNTATATGKATRTLPVAKLEITGPSSVRKGGTATYVVKAFDSASKAISLTGVTSKVEGNIGIFNLQSGTFTAANTEGRGKITVQAGTVTASVDVTVSGANPSATALRIRPVNDGRSVSVNQEMSVTVEVLNANGAVVTDDFGRTVTLAVGGISGLTVTPTSAETINGTATFKVRSATAGTITLMANSSGLTTATGTAIFGTTTRVQLVAEPNSLVAGSNNTVARIKASLVNELGQVIPNNTGADIRVTLTSLGSDGVMADRDITIYRGLSTSTASGDDAFFNAGTTTANTTISGVVTTGQTLSVDPVTITVTAPQVGSASKWEMIYPAGTLAPNPGASDAPYYFSIRMADTTGNTIPANFALQLELSTSNNESKVNGIPSGATVFMSPSGMNPVSDGVAEGQYGDGNDVVVRTNGGMATFGIKYDKVGQVRVKVIGMPATGTAYNTDGTTGSAVSGQVVSNQEFTLNFTTTATNVKLVADSVLGNDKSVGAVSASTASNIKVRALFTSGSGAWIPGATGTVTLQKVTGSSTVIPSLQTINVVDGKAEFTVTATGTPGVDTYKIVNAKHANGTALAFPESNTISLIVQNQAPGAPTILAARGMSGDVPGSWYYVSPSDDALEFEIAPSAAGYATVNFYQQNYSTPFYTSEPVEMTGAPFRIRIPKSKLPTGKMQYHVTFKNAYSETTPRTLTPDYVTNAALSATITVSSAKYDRVNNKLYIYGSGFGTHAGTQPDTVATHLLNVRDASLMTTNPGIATVNLSGSLVESINYSIVTLDVAHLTGALSQLSGSDVTLSAGAGWYTKFNGEIANADSGDPVGPMAKIEYVVYDKASNRLIVTGYGFNTGTMTTSSLKLVKGATELSLASASNYRISDTEWVLYLSNLTNVTTALNADPSYTLSGTNGWFYDSSSTQIAQNAFVGIPVYDKIAVSSVTYDAVNAKLKIFGSGFANWSVAVNKLHIQNLASGSATTSNLTGALVPDESTDTQLVILLADPNPLAGTGGLTKLTGSNLYVTGEDGWLTKVDGGVTRNGAPIPVYMLLLPPQ